MDEILWGPIETLPQYLYTLFSLPPAICVSICRCGRTLSYQRTPPTRAGRGSLAYPVSSSSGTCFSPHCRSYPSYAEDMTINRYYKQVLHGRNVIFCLYLGFVPAITSRTMFVQLELTFLPSFYAPAASILWSYELCSVSPVV